MKIFWHSAIDKAETRLRKMHARLEAQMDEVVRLQREGSDDTQALSLLQCMQETLQQRIWRAERSLRGYEAELNSQVLLDRPLLERSQRE